MAGTQNIAHRRLRRTTPWIAGAIVLAALIAADQKGWLLVKHFDDVGAYHGKSARVLRAVSGDVLEVDLPDALNQRPHTRVKLIGVSCAKPRGDERASSIAADPLALQAMELARAHTKTCQVVLWLEPSQTRDTFSRVLAHVELPDRSKLNEVLLEEGLAKADERWPHSMLVRYAQAELGARKRGLGVWAKPKKID